MSGLKIFTVGHSNRSGDEFLQLLKCWQISAIADVRSIPWSRRNAQFNRDVMKVELEDRGLMYRFLGKSLGGRPTDPELFTNGVADYKKMSEVPAFKEAIKRIRIAAGSHRLALLCSEHDPIDCHRCLLVGRSLAQLDAEVVHILSPSRVEDQNEIEARILRAIGEDQSDFLRQRHDIISHSYDEWSQRVAFAKPEPDFEKSNPEDYRWE